VNGHNSNRLSFTITIIPQINEFVNTFSEKIFLIIFQKPLDKPGKICYNKTEENERRSQQ
jgi:hypothetical protein